MTDNLRGPAHRPVWVEALGETLWGRRGIVKSTAFWATAAVALTRGQPERLAASAGHCLLAFSAVACWSQMAILVNELADRDTDRVAGKRRWICRLSRTAGATWVAMLPLAGAILLVAAGGSGMALLLYAAAVGLALLYSVRPVRMKERGAWGVVAYALCAATGLVAVPWAVLRADAPTLAVLFAAVALDKGVNLLFHQMIDRDGDLKGGVRTFVTDTGIGRARRALRWSAALAAAALAALAAFAVTSLPAPWRHAVTAAIAAAFVVTRVHAAVRRRRAEPNDLVREIPPVYLSATYVALRLLPLLLLARLAVQAPSLWIPASVAAWLVATETTHALRYRLP